MAQVALKLLAVVGGIVRIGIQGFGRSGHLLETVVTRQTTIGVEGLGSFCSMTIGTSYFGKPTMLAQCNFRGDARICGCLAKRYGHN